jgi:hypothetical protein
MKSPAIISPTIGRVVWYWKNPPAEGDNKTQPEAAIVCYVHSDILVNLHVFDHNGVACSVTSVVLRQPGDGKPAHSYCEWMPYQVGQAAKAEAADAAATANVGNALAGADAARSVTPTPTPVPPEPTPDPKQRAR